MTKVQTREDPSLSTTSTSATTPTSCGRAGTGAGGSPMLGSFDDMRSYAMQITTSDTATTAEVTDYIPPPYLRHSHLPDAPGPSTSSCSSSSPLSHPSRPSASSSLPKLTAIRSVQGATGCGDWGEWGVGGGGGGGIINSAVDPLAEELQHPSEMSQGENSLTESHRTSSDSDASLARVDLRDIGEDSHNFTTNTLRKCKLQIMKPYWGLLMFIGWRVFRHDVITPRKCWLRALNIIYPILIVLLLLYTYIYEMVACEWKLDVIKDTLIRTTPKPTSATPMHNRTANSTATPTLLIEYLPAWQNGTNNSSDSDSDGPQPCEHIVTTYLIPNVLHFVAYVMGLYYFRIQDNEQTYALMEKVFLQANPLHTSSSSQQKLVFKTRLFLALGALWVLVTMGLQVLYVWAFNFPRLAIFEEVGNQAFPWVTLSIELVGRVVFNSVLLAIIINYATQCEMVMFYVRGLSLRLQEKSADIKTAFKDTLLLRHNLSLLNGVISKMTSLAMVILAELTIIGISILILNEYDVDKVWVYRSIFPVVWGVMLCFPLFQAARVNYVCVRIKKTSLEMRVFGYKSSSQLELDSFLQFVHATRLRAKLFHVPIQPSFLIASVILVSFTLLLLVQANLIGPHKSSMYI